MLAPEQLRALDYLRRKGTEAPAADLQRSVGQHLAQVQRILSAARQHLPAPA